MTSIRSRFSEASATSLICSGRLLRPASGSPCRIEVEAELGGDHDLVAEGRERLADQVLVGERPVDFGGVEEGYAALDRRADQRDRSPRVVRGAIGEAQAHAAEADRRNLEAALSKLALLHVFLQDDG